MFCHVGELSHRAEFFARSRNRYFLMASITSRCAGVSWQDHKGRLAFWQEKALCGRREHDRGCGVAVGRRGFGACPFSLWQLIPRALLHRILASFWYRFSRSRINKQLVYVTGVLAILSLVVASASTIVSQVIVARYVGAVGHWLRMQLLSKYYSQPYLYFASRNSAVLTKKANTDVYMFTSFLLAPLCDFAARLVYHGHHSGWPSCA